MPATLQTAEGSEAARILAHPDYDVVPYAARYQALGERLGIDFANVLFLLDHLPLALRGEAHVTQRADVARLIAERRVAVAMALPEIVARNFASFGRPGTFDALASCVLPTVEGVIGVIADVDLNGVSANLVSRVFSQAMGVAQRRMLDRELAGLLAQITAAHPEEPPLRHGSRLALVVLGRDAMTGTLARSLHAHIVELAGQPLSSARLAEVPTHTGVPYVDRVAKEGHSDAASVRCEFRALEGASPQERMRFFGAGAHVCLGRPVTLDLFRMVSAYLSGLPTRVTVSAFHLRKDDVFALPDVFEVKVEP